MRIAVVCANASSNSMVRVYPIARVLARRHRLQVVGFRSGPEVYPPYADEFGYETLPQRRLPAFLGQVRSLARRIEADAVLAFKPLASSLWTGLLAARRLRVPLLLDVEDWEAGWYHDVPLGHRLRHLAHVERANGLFWTRLNERLVPRCDEVFVVSRFLQERFGGTLLPHGADTTVFDPALVDGAAARRRLGLEEGRYVVFTGAPMPNKGLGDLLEAVDALDRPDLRVLHVGSFAHDPAYGRALQARHPRRLLSIGPRPHREMPLFLAAADLVALPQRPCCETRAQVPGKVFEAMAMARPLLATAVGDLGEILDGCGLVIPPARPEALREGLRRLLDGRDEAAEMGRRARERCIERYSWDAMERILDGRLARWEKRE